MSDQVGGRDASSRRDVPGQVGRPANAAWFACAVIAHNISRWTAILGGHEPVNTRTLRTRLIAVPAVAVNRSGRPTLRLPTYWPWHHQLATVLANLRALPGPAG